MDHIESEYLYIHSLKLADRLVNAGIRCEGKKVNVQNPRYYDFIFKNTPEAHEMLKQYVEERRNNIRN